MQSDVLAHSSANGCTIFMFTAHGRTEHGRIDDHTQLHKKSSVASMAYPQFIHRISLKTNLGEWSFPVKILFIYKMHSFTSAYTVSTISLIYFLFIAALIFFSFFL